MLREILPLCPGQFETDLDRCREYYPRNGISFRILKFNINHLWTAPFRLICNWIKILFTFENENSARQRDGKGRHIDCHSIAIYCKSLTRSKLLGSLRKITGLILCAALRQYNPVN